MTLERRLAKLEARRGAAGAETGARARLAAILDRLSAAVPAGRDYSQRADASQAESMGGAETGARARLAAILDRLDRTQGGR